MTEKLNIALNEKCKELLKKNNINFKRAELNDLERILLIYKERINWFKENKILQWRKYLEHHPKTEFEEIIRRGEYYILLKNNELVSGFQLSYDSTYWNDNKSQALYIYKIVTKTGTIGIGKIVFYICKNIAKVNNKTCLRLDCLSSNKKLNNIYENHAFKLVSTGCKNGYKYSLREYKIN